MSITILQDTREKMPWTFQGYKECAAQKIEYISEGDYTLEGYPGLIAIERKRNVSELANNLGRKYSQFKKEMERLQKYRFRYVLCEFSQEDMLVYPAGVKLPLRILNKIRMGGKFLQHRVNELVDTYGIEFIFCEDRFDARNTAMGLLLAAQKVYDDENR
jgi:hypothetical protein